MKYESHPNLTLRYLHKEVGEPLQRVLSYHQLHFDQQENDGVGSYRSTVLRYLHKEVGKPLQRVLVHRVDDVEVSDTEVHDGAPVSHRPVPLAALVDLLLRHLCFRHLPRPKMTTIALVYTMGGKRGVCQFQACLASLRPGIL